MQSLIRQVTLSMKFKSILRNKQHPNVVANKSKELISTNRFPEECISAKIIS